MRKRFLILFLLVSAVVYGQTPAGYIKANMRFKWTAGIFDSALHVPQYSGTPSGTRNGAWVGDGAVAIDTVNNLFYFRSGGSWHSTSSGAGWLLTGNSGTTSSNFIGTTDNQPLSFRVNNRWAGRIYTNGSVFIGDSSGVNNSALNNAGFGRYSLYNNTTGSYNTGSGAYSLYGNTTGWDNTGSGAYSLYGNTTGLDNTGSGAYSLYNNTTGLSNTGSGAYSLYSNTTGSNNTGSGAYSLYSNTSGEGNTGSGAYSLYSNIDGELNTGSGVYSLGNNTTGSNNTGSGVYSLGNNTTGSNNTGMGYAAGYNAKQKVDAKNQILIGANTYGTRDSIAVIGASFMKETILRGKLIDSTLSAGAGTKAVRWNSSTGEFTYADTTAGGATPAGNYGNVQINRNGALATPGSDSLDFESATGLTVKGNINAYFNGDQSLVMQRPNTTGTSSGLRLIGETGGYYVDLLHLTSRGYSATTSFRQGEGLQIIGSSASSGFVSIGDVGGSYLKVVSITYGASGAGVQVTAASASAVGMSVKGYASQTADLMQFRNNSNTVMARFDSIGKLGVNTEPVSYVDANGSLGAAITTTSSNITLDATHHTVIITSGTPTITLPAAASSNARRIYVVVNQTGSAVTISSYQNFSGSGTTTVAANSSIQIQSDGSNWYRIL